jgi:hypothetical protein
MSLPLRHNFDCEVIGNIYFILIYQDKKQRMSLPLRHNFDCEVIGNIYFILIYQDKKQRHTFLKKV